MRNAKEPIFEEEPKEEHMSQSLKEAIDELNFGNYRGAIGPVMATYFGDSTHTEKLAAFAVYLAAITENEVIKNAILHLAGPSDLCSKDAIMLDLVKAYFEKNNSRLDNKANSDKK